MSVSLNVRVSVSVCHEAPLGCFPGEFLEVLCMLSKSISREAFFRVLSEKYLLGVGLSDSLSVWMQSSLLGSEPCCEYGCQYGNECQ